MGESLRKFDTSSLRRGKEVKEVEDVKEVKERTGGVKLWLRPTEGWEVWQRTVLTPSSLRTHRGGNRAWHSSDLALAVALDKEEQTPGQIHSDFATGLIYSDEGKVADPTTQAIVGTYNASGLVAPDSSLNRVFILGQTTGPGWHQQLHGPVLRRKGLRRTVVHYAKQSCRQPHSACTLGTVGPCHIDDESGQRLARHALFGSGRNFRQQYSGKTPFVQVAGTGAAPLETHLAVRYREDAASKKGIWPSLVLEGL